MKKFTGKITHKQPERDYIAEMYEIAERDGRVKNGHILTSKWLPIIIGV